MTDWERELQQPNPSISQLIFAAFGGFPVLEHEAFIAPFIAQTQGGSYMNTEQVGNLSGGYVSTFFKQEKRLFLPLIQLT